MSQENFIQEAFVGYKYGTFSKLGVVCQRTPVAEETKHDEGMEVDQAASATSMDKFNMETFL